MQIEVIVGHYLKDRGIKHNWLANKIDVAPERLSRLFREERTLRANEFIDICKAINVTTDSMLEYGDFLMGLRDDYKIKPWIK